MSKSQPDYKYAAELIDAVMDYIAQKWTPSMIRRQLREYFPDIRLKTCNFLIHKAKATIRERYNISPEEYKGEQIAFYESVIRSNKVKVDSKLKAAERLDKLFGLENISNVDPAAIVEKILEFKRQANNTIGGKEDGDNTNGGQSEDGKTEDNRSGEQKRGKDSKHNEPRDESKGDTGYTGLAGKSKDNNSDNRTASAEENSNRSSDVSTDGNVQQSKEQQDTVDENSTTVKHIDENLPTHEEVNDELGFKEED